MRSEYMDLLKCLGLVGLLGGGFYGLVMWILRGTEKEGDIRAGEVESNFDPNANTEILIEQYNKIRKYHSEKAEQVRERIEGILKPRIIAQMRTSLDDLDLDLDNLDDLAYDLSPILRKMQI